MVSFSLEGMLFADKDVVTIKFIGTPEESGNSQMECKEPRLPYDFSCPVTFTTVGHKGVTVSVDGGEGCRTSSVGQIMINEEGPALTSLKLGSNRGDIVREGETVTFYAWVAGERLDQEPVTGTVTITAGSNACSVPVENGKAECSLKMNSAGSVHLRAAYKGDKNYLPSAINTYWLVKASSKVQASANPNPAYAGSQITVDFTVSNLDGTDTLLPTGDVLIYTSESLDHLNPDARVRLINGSGTASIKFDQPDAAAEIHILFYGKPVFEYSETIIKIKIVAYQALTGCWVYSYHGSQCVSPCPDPAEYPNTCTT